jgi:hypothetical protein
MRPAFRFTWLVAIGGALLAWVSVILWQISMPLSLALPAWQPAGLFADSPAFLADRLSWPYAFSLVTLALAVLLTGVARENFPSAVTWAGTLTLIGMGLLAVTAANPLTLVLVWTAIDLAELVSRLRSANTPGANESIVVAFSMRVAGIGLLLWANILSLALGSRLDFGSIPPQAGVLLLLAAALRLGVLPLHLSYASESPVRRGFSATLTLVSAASSLVLLVHIPAQSLGSVPLLVLLGLTSAAALFGGWMFLRAPDDLAGRPFWIIGLAALSVAAALFGNPAGAAAWGCVLVLAGGALFLSSMQRPWLNRILLIGGWSLSGLPFSLGASGWSTAGNGLWLLPFLIGGQALLMAGFIRHALRSPIRQPFESLEVWAQKIYPIGILLLLAAQLILGAWGWDGALQVGLLPAALGATGLAMLLFWAMPRFAFLNPVRAHWVRPSPAPWLDSLYRGLGGAYRRLTQVSQAITDILEGDGGIMWTLLFLVLFISLFSQARR